MRTQLDNRIRSALDERISAGLYRQKQVFEHSGVRFQTGQVTAPYLNFASNDYLGLANDAELAKSFQRNVERFGAGSAASPVVTGHGQPHQELEDTLCDWLGYPAALLMSSGFAANQAVLFSLMQKGDVIVEDKLSHASLIEAGVLSPATLKRFKHNSVSHLDSLLSQQSRLERGGVKLIVTESVFSMDGDISPAEAIQQVCTKYDATLLVDDAHGCGVLGDGRGVVSQGCRPDILIVTFGKAFGLMGAAILASREIIDYLRQFARHYVYSTAIPPSLSATLIDAVSMIRNQSWRREKLAELTECYNRSLSCFDEVIATDTPIKPVILGSISRLNAVSDSLKKSGLWTGSIRPPTVPPNTARLRITLSANHSLDDVRHLSNALSHALNEEVV